MEFGYFTLSDNRYPGNPRTAEAFIKDIYEEALWAEKVGLHSAWIGEHHFNLLGVNASPLAILAQLAGATTRLRLAPAVTLLPVHHPLHVAEEWATLDLLSGGRVDFAAGRGYDRKEYEPFGAPFDQSAELFAEGLEIVWRAWTEPGKWSHKGRFYDVQGRRGAAQAGAARRFGPMSPASRGLRWSSPRRNDWNVIYAPFAAAMVYGSLADAVRVYRETCECRFKRPMRRAMCSYFVHIASTPQEERYGKEALVRYFQDALIAAFPSSSGEKVPPTYKYFVDIVNILRDMRPEKLTDKSILCGSPQHIVDTLKTVEASGIAEVILYFNYGQKPHALVKEQMERFMREVAPHFARGLTPWVRSNPTCPTSSIGPARASRPRSARRCGRSAPRCRSGACWPPCASGTEGAWAIFPTRHRSRSPRSRAWSTAWRRRAWSSAAAMPRMRARSCCTSRPPAGASRGAFCRSPTATRPSPWRASMPPRRRR